VRILEEWMKSYRPTELFDENGKLRPELAEIAPRGQRRMSANPHTNGGLLLRDLRLPDFRDYAVGRSPQPRAHRGDGCLMQVPFVYNHKRIPFSVAATSSAAPAAERGEQLYHCVER
jgi:hypothetical protein